MPVPVVIEVALNGATQPARNRNVPTTPGAIAEDAIRCIEAGASIVHAHTPIQDFTLPGKEAAERYLAIFQPILAAHPDALLYPTIGAGVDMTARLEHVEHHRPSGHRLHHLGQARAHARALAGGQHDDGERGRFRLVGHGPNL